MGLSTGTSRAVRASPRQRHPTTRSGSTSASQTSSATLGVPSRRSFGARMEVEIVNDGQVTIVLDVG